LILFFGEHPAQFHPLDQVVMRVFTAHLILPV
jgi:hypothetical protein